MPAKNPNRERSFNSRNSVEIFKNMINNSSDTQKQKQLIENETDPHLKVQNINTEDIIFNKNNTVFNSDDTEEEIIQAENAIRRYNRGVRLSGHACLHPDDNREEEVVNDINGTETDCVLSVLSSPYQESFISRYRTLLNTKLWFGCGPMLSRSYDDQMIFQQIRHFFRKTMFRRQVEKQQKEK